MYGGSTSYILSTNECNNFNFCCTKLLNNYFIKGCRYNIGDAGACRRQEVISIRMLQNKCS